MGILAGPLLGCCLLGSWASGSKAKVAGTTVTAQAGEGLALCKLRVDGMTCGACEREVNKALRANVAVKDTKADWELGRAWVTYDPTKAKPEELASLVTAAGYAAVAESITATTGEKTATAPKKAVKKIHSGVMP